MILRRWIQTKSLLLISNELCWETACGCVDWKTIVHVHQMLTCVRWGVEHLDCLSCVVMLRLEFGHQPQWFEDERRTQVHISSRIIKLRCNLWCLRPVRDKRLVHSAGRGLNMCLETEWWWWWWCNRAHFPLHNDEAYSEDFIFTCFFCWSFIFFSRVILIRLSVL